MSVHTFLPLSAATVQRFVHPRTIPTAIAFGLALTLPAVALQFLLKILSLSDRPRLLLSIEVVSISLLLGFFLARFALGARAGDIESGFLRLGTDRGEAMAFACRYASLVAALVLAANLLLSLGAKLSLPGLMLLGTLSLPLVAILVVLGQVPLVLVASASEGLFGSLNPRVWLWVMDHCGPLVPLITACYIGGLLSFGVFLFLGALPLLLLLMALDPGAGTVAAMALVSLPFAGAPILLGRLCGAAVVGAHTEALGEAPTLASPSQAPSPLAGARPFVSPPPTPIVPTAPTPKAAAPPKQTGVTLLSNPYEGQQPQLICDSLAALKSSPAEETTLQVTLALAAQPNSHLVRWTASQLLTPHDPEKGLEHAGHALVRALQMGANPTALEIWETHAGSAASFPLTPALAQQLATLLLHQRDCRSSAWAWHRSLALGAPEQAVIKGLVGVAQSASTADPAYAVTLYQWITSNYPQNTLADYCRTELSRLELSTQAP